MADFDVLLPRAWAALQQQSPPEDTDLEKLSAEFEQLMQADKERLDYDYGASIREAWSNDMDAYRDGFSDRMIFDDEGVPKLGAYEFGMMHLHPTRRVSRLMDFLSFSHR